MSRIASIFAALGLLCCASGCVTVVAKDNQVMASGNHAPATGFINKTLDNGYKYAVYVPAEYSPEKAWPLIVFLHGAGERGDNGLAQTDVGIGHAVRFHPERFPAIILMPQCPKDLFWNAIWDELQISLARTQSEYRIDPDRVYLTGLSMGGYGTWLWGGIAADRFAALMPICGGGEIPAKLAGSNMEHPFGTLDARISQLAKVPIWVFHGSDDTTVPPERSREMVERVRAAGGDVHYTEFPKTGHNSWDQAYDDAEAIAWLFEQHR